MVFKCHILSNNTIFRLKKCYLRSKQGFQAISSPKQVVSCHFSSFQFILGHFRSFLVISMISATLFSKPPCKPGIRTKKMDKLSSSINVLKKFNSNDRTTSKASTEFKVSTDESHGINGSLYDNFYLKTEAETSDNKLSTKLSIRSKNNPTQVIGLKEFSKTREKVKIGRVWFDNVINLYGFEAKRKTDDYEIRFYESESDFRRSRNWKKSMRSDGELQLNSDRLLEFRVESLTNFSVSLSDSVRPDLKLFELNFIIDHDATTDATIVHEIKIMSTAQWYENDQIGTV